jgi:N-acetylglucosaminyldiphosphoundecaprenol N-acetyl-beta-D-mannosaminyltransferase
MNIEIFEYNIYGGKLENILPTLERRKRVINTLNAYSFVKAESDRLFKKSLQNSDILIPDGFPIVTAVRLLKKTRIKKIAGEDLYFHLLKQLNDIQGSCFFLGSSVETLEKIHTRLIKDFPNVKSSSFSPPFKEQFDQTDLDKIIDSVNAVKPDILFVGLTAPKQEKLVSDIHKHIECGDICSIGAVFDFYAGTQKRPNKFWINLKLEWFLRLLHEPSRLWRRYLIYSPLFFHYLFKQYLKEKLK